MMESFATIPQERPAGKKSGKPRKIAVAMSGGVDSSVAAALLQRQGAQVQGVFMALAQPDLAEQLRWVRAVAAFLKIPLTVVDLAEPFRREVVDYFCAGYFAGNHPGMFLKIPVGKIQPKAIDPGSQQTTLHGSRKRGRPQGGHDLGLGDECVHCAPFVFRVSGNDGETNGQRPD